MCGIAGIYSYHPAANPAPRDELIRIRDAMIPRGPDDCGEWRSENGRVALGHRRLSILDLSTAGHQPMRSACGRYTIVFNGEIYNYPALRAELEAEGVGFCSSSDTEVLLHLYKRRGKAMLSVLRGMFAFAIWDQETASLFAARDPYGIKPLYYTDDGWTVRFASQVRAIRAGGGVSDDPDPAGLVGFYLWGSVPEPHTLYRDIRVLPAGCFLQVDGLGSHEPRVYTSVAKILSEGAANPVPDAEVEKTIKNAAKESVAAHLLADVEVGLFLSAGIDSGALLGLMRDAGAEKVRAITLGFSEFQGSHEDETILASKVAAHYDAEHVVRFVGEKEFLEDLPAILHHMDQPSIDGVNTWFVSKAAKEAGLKVALSGLGSDEILAGYPSFTDIPNWVSKMRPIAGVPGLGVLGRKLLSWLPAVRTNPKLAGLPQYGSSYPGAYLLRRGLFMPWELEEVLDDPAVVAEGLRRLDPLGSLRRTLLAMPRSPISRVSALESCHYMRNQLLRDADWAGMAHSVEIRVPFVDVSFLRSVASATPHLVGRRGKAALATSPSVPLPAEVANRAKTGFGVPTGAWLNRVVGDNSSTKTKGEASRGWAQNVLRVQMAKEVAGGLEIRPT